MVPEGCQFLLVRVTCNFFHVHANTLKDVIVFSITREEDSLKETRRKQENGAPYTVHA